MSDINHLSMEDLVKFAQEGVLPDEDGVANESIVESKEEIDPNTLSMDDLMAMAQGEAPQAKEEVPVAVEVPDGNEAEDGEASEEDLMKMLENTLGEDELGDDQVDLELAKNIDKIKLRQLANKLEEMSPKGLFPPKKDEIYYFLSTMVGQGSGHRMEAAKEKCEFIGKSLQSMESYMISEVEFSLDEHEVILVLFESHSKEVVDKSESRLLVFEQFKSGWRQTLKQVLRDKKDLDQYSKERIKPIWILIKFYESLSKAYGLCRAQIQLSPYAQELGVEMTREEKRSIVGGFEDMLEISPYYGLKMQSVDRKGCFQELAKIDLIAIVNTLSNRKKTSR